MSELKHIQVCKASHTLYLLTYMHVLNTIYNDIN